MPPSDAPRSRGLRPSLARRLAKAQHERRCAEIVRAMLESVKSGKTVQFEPDWGGYSVTLYEITTDKKGEKLYDHTHCGLDTDEYEDVVASVHRTMTGSGWGLSWHREVMPSGK